MKDNYIRFDWAIKRLLRQKANFGVLEGFLSVLLDEKVEIIELLESESNQLAIDGYPARRVDRISERRHDPCGYNSSRPERSSRKVTLLQHERRGTPCLR